MPYFLQNRTITPNQKEAIEKFAADEKPEGSK